MKSVSDLSKLCRGAVMVETFGMCAAKKLIILSRRLMPALSVGLVISTIALTFIGSSLIPSEVTMVPRYLTSFTCNCSLSKLNLMLFSLAPQYEFQGCLQRLLHSFFEKLHWLT